MDILSPTPSLPTASKKHWPEQPAERGKTYNVADPMYPNTRLAVMTLETWVDFGTIHEALRRKVEQQDKTLIHQHALNEVLTKELAELKLKHENLRGAVKAKRRAAVGFFK